MHIKHLRTKQKTKHVSSWSSKKTKTKNRQRRSKHTRKHWQMEPSKIKEFDLLDWAHLHHHGNLASLYWIHTQKKNTVDSVTEC